MIKPKYNKKKHFTFITLILSLALIYTKSNNSKSIPIQGKAIIKIGNNSIIAGQVGIAGSSIIGSNVKIGGQAGISGHLKIGNNVEIGGGSGVIRNIPDNTKVMGYPAKNIREFLKENK